MKSILVFLIVLIILPVKEVQSKETLIAKRRTEKRNKMERDLKAEYEEFKAIEGSDPLRKIKFYNDLYLNFSYESESIEYNDAEIQAAEEDNLSTSSMWFTVGYSYLLTQNISLGVFGRYKDTSAYAEWIFGVEGIYYLYDLSVKKVIPYAGINFAYGNRNIESSEVQTTDETSTIQQFPGLKLGAKFKIIDQAYININGFWERQSITTRDEGNETDYQSTRTLTGVEGGIGLLF